MSNNYKYIEAKYKGELAQFEKQNNGQYKLTRLLSTNPSVYLNKDLQPGILIDKSKLENK